MTLKVAVAGVIFLLFSMIIYLSLIAPAQRQLTLRATQDLKLYDIADKTRQIGVLPQGKTATILRCDDTKSSIDPIVELEGGQTGYVLTSGFAISSTRTGWLSRPRYLHCGDF
jgi:hypothetical protein